MSACLEQIEVLLMFIILVAIETFKLGLCFNMENQKYNRKNGKIRRAVITVKILILKRLVRYILESTNRFYLTSLQRDLDLELLGICKISDEMRNFFTLIVFSIFSLIP